MIIGIIPGLVARATGALPADNGFLGESAVKITITMNTAHTRTRTHTHTHIHV